MSLGRLDKLGDTLNDLTARERSATLSAGEITTLPAAADKVLVDLDCVRGDGNNAVRSKRGALVAETQGQLDRLERRQGLVKESLDRGDRGDRGDDGARMIIGLDFGTAFSGFSMMDMSDVGGEELPRCYYDWEDAPSAQYAKTLTQILYKRDESGTWQPYLWGYPAAMRADEVKNDPNYQLVKRFKLDLDHAGEDTTVNREDITGGTFAHRTPPPGKTTLDVIADYLQFLRGVIERELQKRYGQLAPPLSAVRWCLTVPAMWTEEAKSNMCLAAEKAGLVDSRHSRMLHIILEPEAAAVYALKRSNEAALGAGSVFVMVDEGGETVDLTAHHVVLRAGYHGDHGQVLRLALEELASKRGKSGGASSVDEHFLAFVKKRVGAQAFKQALRERPRIKNELLNKWEPYKRRFGSEAKMRPAVIPIPTKLHAAMSREAKEALENAQGGDDDEILLTEADMKEIFDRVVDRVLDLVRAVLGDTEKAIGGPVPAMLVVGGFGSSPYLLKRIREEYGGRVERIVCPENAGAAVVIGAALYGINPRVVCSRISRYTYGIRSSTKYDPEKHMKWESSAEFGDILQERRLSIFNVFAKAGESVDVDKVVTHGFGPVYPTQSKVGFHIHHSERENPFLMSEPGITPLGESVEILIDMDVPFDERKIEVHMKFGASQIVMDVIPTWDRAGIRTRRVDFTPR